MLTAKDLSKYFSRSGSSIFGKCLLYCSGAGRPYHVVFRLAKQLTRKSLGFLVAGQEV